MAADTQNDTETTAAATSRKRKPAARKRAVKRSSGRTSPTRTRSASVRSRTRGYEGAAAGLMRRGQRLAGDAQSWMESARGAVPRLTRNMHLPTLPSAPSLETFTEASPVILGAVGLGIGMIIGALLPRDALHTGMQGMGLVGSGRATPSRSAAKRGKPRRRR